MVRVIYVDRQVFVSVAKEHTTRIATVTDANDFHYGDLLFACEREERGCTGRVLEAKTLAVYNAPSLMAEQHGIPAFTCLDVALINHGFLEELKGRDHVDVFTLKNSRGFPGMTFE